MSLRATGYLLTRAACLLSVRLKKNVGTKRRPQDVRFTELLIGGKKKNRSVVKKIQYHHIERKEYAIYLHISKNYCTFAVGFEKNVLLL